MSCACAPDQEPGRGLCPTHYAAYRTRQIAYGRWKPRVPATDVRGHVEAMRAAGVNANQLAKLAGISQPALTRIMSAGPDARVSSRLHDAVLAVPVPERAADVTADNALVPILGARRRFQALVASGYPATQLARELSASSLNHRTIRALMGHRIDHGRPAQQIGAERERAVKDLFDRLQLVPGPSAQARALGQRHRWPLPMEWDENALDDPHGRPTRSRWTSASSRSERHEQVADLTARGFTSTQIAEQLGMNVRLVARDRALASAHRAAEPTPDLYSDNEFQAMNAVAERARADIAARRARPRRQGLERTR
ncbi:helix-turn-helix domain-containing protein [Nocardia sp. NPDC055321]